VSAAAPAEAQVQVPPEEPQSIRGVVHDRIEAIRAGDVGSLPVLIGIVAITIFFTAKSSFFFTAVNFQNLIGQMAGVTTIAIGVVFVLLIGEIDLSIAYLGAVAAVIMAELQIPGSGHDWPGLLALAAGIAVGVGLGALQGTFIAFVGVPSFVVTLAGLLAWEGLVLKIIGTQGVIGIQDALINDVSNYVLPTNVGWALAAVFAIGYGAAAIGGQWSRRRRGLSFENPILTVIRVVFWAVLAFTVVAVCNHAQPRPGVPFVGLLVVALTLIGSWLAGRTTFGLHVYAVGGSAEAARRAGINVKLIRILVFMISGAMAAMGGIILASRLNSVDLTSGGGTILLDAISAAVIGGVSLFGGRGFVKGALYGGLIIAMIANGIDLVGYSDATKYITTAVILLAAVTLDTVLRRRQAAAGH
jgi:D-xylose transport system permease protein